MAISLPAGGALQYFCRRGETKPCEHHFQPMDDSVYYRDGLSVPLAERLLRLARTRMYELFVDQMRPGPETTILDVGISDEENDASNFLEKLYPHRRMITAAGLGDGQQVRKHFPEISFVRITEDERLPFPDKSFDIVYSNAVLEHVGDAARRQRFLAELERVGRRVFVAVPNGWFPIEHHTALPFIHYVPSLFRAIVRRTDMKFWAQPENLDFLSARELRRAWPRGDARVLWGGIPLGPFSSNLVLVSP
jgi:SAM-dependent methyltransferase